MSGFGIRAFKKHKEDHLTEEKRQFIQHIVYGENSFAILTYLKLKAQYGAEVVKLVSPTFIDKQTVLNEWKCSLNTIRDEVTANLLMEKKPQLEIFPSQDIVTFYKDSKFHDFNGRTKSFEIKPGEEYFQQPLFHIKNVGLFSDEEWNNLDESLSTAQLNKFVNKIELATPADLVEKVNFILHTGEFEKIECEKLYWCESPKTFYKKVENKNKINEALGNFCNAVDHQAAMSVYFEVDAQIYEGRGTVFLPQSVTHEWGHFICDFEAFDPASKKQKFVCMMFVNEDEVNEEELAKKLRLMKRVIERTMPEFAKAKHSEHIHYRSDMFMSNILDELADDIEFDHADLKFIGLGAPIDKSQIEREIKYLPRAIVSYLSI